MVLFRQPRAGFNDRVIEVWKFRTMYADARDDRAVHQTKRNDPRVTRVGRILRRTSLDELPQLFNVLAGSMSIVGPRPHALGMTAAGAALHDVIEDYSARHRLKPGITGWAQVNGCRGEVRTHDQLRRRVSLDCYYIENWSLRLDLWIIARTAVKILNDSDAY
jgi:lipopolysaccharide/colanic/teichoic acid biosynthesis glycosyltransferase